jgi:uncharacterized membrane protein
MAMSEYHSETEPQVSVRNVLPSRSEADRHSHGRRRNSFGNGGQAMHAQRLARALGWLSIGLGVAEVTAPGTVARWSGMNDNRGLLRMLGVREIAHGVGILSRRKPVGWIWSRVFGDVIDLAVLGKAAAAPTANKRRIAAAAAAVTGVTVLDFKAGQQLARVADQIPEEEPIRVTTSVLIGRPAEEIYCFWRDFKNLPRIMAHLESVETLDDRRSRWVAAGPAGKSIAWDAEITDEKPNQLIAWRSVAGSTVENSGRVKFVSAPGGRGTIVSVELTYWPPAGMIGATVAKLFGEEPQIQIKDDLRRLKQNIEAGESITTEGQPAGRARSTSWKYDHAGRRIAAAY